MSDPFGHQPFAPQLGDALLGLDLRVHLGLGVGGLVGLVVAEAPVADQVDQDVVAELLAEGEGEAHGADARRHVVGVDVDDRDVEALGEVRGPARRSGVVRIGREADLVVHDDVDRAAHLVAVEGLEVERLGDHALRREGGVAVDHDRHGSVGVLRGARPAAGGLRGARGALDDRRDELEVARVRLEVHADRVAFGKLVCPLGAVVVLHVAGAALGDRRDRLQRRGALELGEDRVVGAAEVVREYVQAPAVGHADHDLLAAVRRRELDQLVEHRHRHVEALDRELVLAKVGLVHEPLERVDLDEPLEEHPPFVVAQRLAEAARLDVLAQPNALAVRSDVLDLVRSRAAVGVQQVLERVRERRSGDVHLEDVGGELGEDLRRQSERHRVEARIALGLGAERVEVGGEVAVAAHPADERRHPLHRAQQFLAGDEAGGSLRSGRGGGRRRSGRLRRGAQLDSESREHVRVETVLPLQEVLDLRQEATGLGALDDAVVVRGGHRHDLLRADRRPDAPQPDRVGDRAGRDDRALAVHQPRHRRHGPEAAGIGEADVRPDEVVGGERVRAGLLHERVVSREEPVEGQARGVADHGDHQRAGAVLLLHVHGQAQVDLTVVYSVRLALDERVVVAHHRHLGGGAHDRVGDQVGERDLAARCLELAASRVEHGHRERAEARRGRDLARGLHVAGERGRPASQQLRARALARGHLCGCVAGRDRAGARGREDVGLGDAPSGPATGDPLQRDALGCSRARGDRRDPDTLRDAGGGAGGRSGGRLGGRSGCGARRLRSGSDGDARDHLPDRHRLTLVDEDLADGAGRGRGQLDVDLVG